MSTPDHAETVQQAQSNAADASVGTAAPSPATRDHAQLLRLLDSQVQQHLNLRSGGGRAVGRAGPAPTHAGDLAPAAPAPAMTTPAESASDVALPMKRVVRPAQVPPRAAARNPHLTTVLTAMLCGTTVLGIGWALERAAGGARPSGEPPSTTTSSDAPAQPAALPTITSPAAASASAPLPTPPGGTTGTTCAAAATALALCKPSTR